MSDDARASLTTDEPRKVPSGGAPGEASGNPEASGPRPTRLITILSGIALLLVGGGLAVSVVLVPVGVVVAVIGLVLLVAGLAAPALRRER